MKKGKKILIGIFTACMLVSTFSVSALASGTYYYWGDGEETVPGSGAAEYVFDGDSSGDYFYESTSTDRNNVADSGQIVVGTDGAVSSGTTGNTASEPLTALDLPVGEYPEAYGFQTDVAIANNSIFPNELGPTSSNFNYYTPTFVRRVSSGALPTGNTYIPSVYSPSVAYPVVDGFYVPTYSAYYPYFYTGHPMGLATSIAGMPALTAKGAIGRVTISSVGINAYVYEGTSTANMRKGVAHFDCTSGWEGNIGLAGHNRGSWAYFAKLKDVKLGDVVKYTTVYGTNTYVVNSITTVSVNDTSGLQQDGQNKITMYTCKANQPEVKLCVVATLVSSAAA